MRLNLSKTSRIFLVLLFCGIFFASYSALPVKAQGTTLPAQMNKGFSPVTISAGGVSTLSINIYNPNPFPLTLSSSPAAWTDTLPAYLFFASPANPTTTCGGTVSIIGNTISLVGGTVPEQVLSTPGSCTVTVRVTSTVPGNKVNTIPANTLQSTDPTGTISVTNTTPASATLGVNTVLAPTLSKAYPTSNTVYVGEPVTMRLSIRNTDTSTALTSVNVTDNFPTNVVVNTAPASPQCGGTVTYTPTSVTLTGGTVAANATCNINVSVSSIVPGVYTNIIPAGSITTTQGVTNASPASAPLNVQPFRIGKTFTPANFQVGGESTVTLTLNNPSSTGLTGVNLTDNLPTGLTVPSAPTASQCNGGTVTYTASSVTLTGGAIPGGTYSVPGTCTIVFPVTASIAASYTNVIPANSLVTDQGVTNITTTTTNLTVYGTGRGVGLTKNFSASPIAVNGTSRLSLSITAPGDYALTGFSISDSLPTGMQVAVPTTAPSRTNCGTGTFAPLPGDTLLTYSGGTINAGATCVLAVDVTGTIAGTLTNTISPANISNTQGQTISTNVSRDLVVSGLTVGKLFSPNRVTSGNVSVLTIQLTNTNDMQVDSVQFTDTLPGTSPNDLIVDTSPVITNTCGGTVTALGGSKTISLSNGVIPARIGGVNGTCTVNVEVIGRGTSQTHTNRLAVGSVTGVLHGTSTTISNPAEATAGLTINTVSISVNKSFNPLTVFGGSASTLSVTLTNGGYAVSNISFSDNLPQGTGGGMYVANPANISTGGCGGTLTAVPGATSFSYSGGSLAANAVCTLSLSVGMNVNGNLTNTLPIGSVTTANGASNTTQAQASLTNTPGVSITKAFGPNPISTGSGTSTMSFTLLNTGNAPLSELRFADTLPAGLTVPAPPVTPQCGGAVAYDAGTNTISLTDGAIPGLSSCVINVDVSVTIPGNYTNCIPSNGLTSHEGASNHDATCDTLRVVSPPVISKVFSPSTIAAGQNSTLTFTLSNPAANTIALTGVGFTDTFPGGMTIASVPNAVQCNGTVTSTANSITLTGGSLAIGNSCNVVVSVTSSTGGSHINTSDPVTSTNGGTGNTASATLNVVSPPAISKDFTIDPMPIGGTTPLVFTITNPNPSTALTGVAFSDTLPTGMFIRTPTGAGFSNCGSPTFAPVGGGSSLTFSGGTIAVGGTCTVTVDVTSAIGGDYSNTSSTVSSTNGGTNLTPASDTLHVAGAGLSLEKSTTQTSFSSAGSTVTYDYLLTNTGDVPLYAPFTVSDDHLGTPLNTPFNCGAAAQINTGETVSCSAVYTVQAADVAARVITNTARAHAMDAAVGGNTVDSNQDSVTLRFASLSFSKTNVTQYFTTVGDTINYTYTLTNTGNVTLYPPFMVSDDHINGGTAFSCRASAPASLPVGGNILCDNQPYTVLAGDVSTRSVTNTAHATARDAAGATLTSNNSSATVYLLIPPTISKSFSPSNIPVGTNSTLSFTIGNPATNMVALTGVGFIDNLPSGVTVAEAPLASQCGGTVTLENSNARIRLTGATILPNSSCTITVLVTSGTRGSYLNTTGTISSTNGGTGLTASATINVFSPPGITKAFSPNIISVGQNSTLTFTLTNPNASILTGINFTDSLPAGLQVASTPSISMSGCNASSSPVFSPASGDTSLSLSNASIAASPGTCVISVNVTGVTSGTKNNITSAVVSTEGGTGSTSNTATLQVNNPALTLVKSITSGTPYDAVGDVVNYQYHLTNSGNVTLIGNGTGGLFTVTDDHATVTCPATPAGLDPGNSIDCTASYTIDLDDMNNGSVTNTAVGHGLYGATPVTSNTATQTATATQSPAISLDKSITAFANYAAVGQVIQYSYLLTNSGNVTIRGTGTGGEFLVDDDHASVTCPLTTTELDPTETVTCTASYTVIQADLDAGNVLNTATAHARFGAIPFDSNVDTANALSHQTPEITLVKTVTSGDLYIAAGDTVEYSYLLTNSGNVTLTGNGTSNEFTVTDDHTTVTCPLTTTSLAPGDAVTCTATYLITAGDITTQSVTNTAQGHGEFGATAVDSITDTATVNIRRGDITGTVYFDQNSSGTMDTGETPIAGVTIDIYDSTGTTLLTTLVTDISGSFIYTNQLPGNFVVVEHDPVGYVSTTPNRVTVTVTPGGTAHADYGDYRATTSATNLISGYVFNDANINGVLDGTEVFIPGVTVQLLDSSGAVVGTTTTDVSGRYVFNSLSAGVYTVVETNPGGYASSTLDRVNVPLTTGAVGSANFGDHTGAASLYDPAITKSGSPATVRSGDTVIYTITVGNNGTANASGVILTDDLPDMLDLVNIDISPNLGQTVTITGNRFTIDFGTVRPVDSFTVTVVTTVNALGVPPGGTNRASLASTSFPDPTFNNSSSVDTAIYSNSGLYMPETGFSPDTITTLPVMPENLYQSYSDLSLEIPAIGTNSKIVGLTMQDNRWDVTWLGNDLGYLEETAFPSWNGNSVITGHVYKADGTPGPFQKLSQLKYGDEIHLHIYGLDYVYEVREVMNIKPDDVKTVLKHEENPWLTLLTCQGYDEQHKAYRSRVLVRAVLVKLNSQEIQK